MAVWKHPTYRTLYLREPIPPELQAAAGGRKTYKRSLGTDQQAEARQRYPAALVAFQAFIDGLRNGPRRLTAQDVEGLVGIWYREKLEAWSADPGAAKDWESAWLSLPSGDTPGDLQARSRIVSPAVDALLDERGLSVDTVSRAALEARLFDRLVTLMSRIERRAGGDYSHDPVLDQFPAAPVVAPKDTKGTPGRTAGDGLYADGTPTWDAMFARWEAKAARARSLATVSDYRGAWSAFQQYVYRTAQRVQPSSVETYDVEQWRDSLLIAGSGGRPLKRKTVQGKYLAAVSAVYAASQGKGKGFLTGNPVDGAWFAGSKFADSQEVRPYTAAELATILRAARAESLPERRWLPWLMAYSGARFREATQSLAADVREIDGIPFLSINQDRPWKRLKNPSSERNVPLHSHLIAEGFLSYARSLAPGAYLFPRMKPRADGGSAEGRPVTALRDWVSSLVTQEVDSNRITRPTHSFRHSFEDLLCNATEDARLRLVIQGREDGSSAADYGDGFTLRKVYAVLERIPPLV